jgi:vacuolar protein-sorting-associated protein 4
MFDPYTIPILIFADEKNEKSKQMIKKKVSEYLERAEKLKNHLAKPTTTKDGKPASAAANGIGAGGKAKSLLFQGVIY